GEVATSGPAVIDQVVAEWFRENVWEVGPESGAAAEQAQRVAETRENVLLLSRDPARADFLVPGPGTQLAAPRGGGSFVGAKPAATTESPSGGVDGVERKATNPP